MAERKLFNSFRESDVYYSTNVPVHIKDYRVYVPKNLPIEEWSDTELRNAMCKISRRMLGNCEHCSGCRYQAELIRRRDAGILGKDEFRANPSGLTQKINPARINGPRRNPGAGRPKGEFRLNVICQATWDKIKNEPSKIRALRALYPGKMMNDKSWGKIATELKRKYGESNGNMG